MTMSTWTTDRPLAVLTGTRGGIGYELAGRFAGSVRNKVQAVADRIIPDWLRSEQHPWMDEPGSDDFPG